MLDSVSVFRALADPVRLEIIKCLQKDIKCVNEITLETKFSQPNISQHLRILKQAGIVEMKRRGKKHCYSIKNKNILKMMKLAE